MIVSRFHTCGCHLFRTHSRNSISLTTPSPPLYSPVPPDPSRNMNWWSIVGYLRSKTSGSVICEIGPKLVRLMKVCSDGQWLALVLVLGLELDKISYERDKVQIPEFDSHVCVDSTRTVPCRTRSWSARDRLRITRESNTKSASHRSDSESTIKAHFVISESRSVISILILSSHSERDCTRVLSVRLSSEQWEESGWLTIVATTLTSSGSIESFEHYTRDTLWSTNVPVRVRPMGQSRESSSNCNVIHWPSDDSGRVWRVETRSFR